ncbi:MAG TPA: HpcH/HpaI aldolase/citrate lyase family protein [Rhizomicrobium sp.]|jgi:4-hydroxy-2-oxoheptanedioate aldolase|nr:HpcH/HpaI aldolase/citrate lyase family protein [Rhizomicrobium sp.]
MNRLKSALANGQVQYGLWQSLASPFTAEICAAAGFDWLLFDGEHAPNTVVTLLAQLQAASAYPVELAARPPVGDPVLIKQYLDIGFRSLVIPMVGSVEQARLLAAATRFPPTGIRGVAGLTRASGFGARPDYLARTHEDICLILQIENRAGLEAAEEIASVEGVDALFIGPSDLAGSLGHLGNPGHPEVQQAIAAVIKAAKKVGKAAGIFATSVEMAKRYAGEGAAMISVGSDIGLLTSGSRALRQSLGT